MLGISLRLAAATTVVLVTDTAETREIVLQYGPIDSQYTWTLRLNPATGMAYNASRSSVGLYRSLTGIDANNHIVLMTDPGWTLRIRWGDMTYKITRERGRGEWPTINAGCCSWWMWV